MCVFVRVCMFSLQGAHALLLCTRSGFFARALSAGFIEQERRVVHLGIVEEPGIIGEMSSAAHDS